MLSHIQQTDVSVPYRDGAWWYYTRTEEGLQYAIHCRKKDTLEAPEEILLDGNELAQGHAFFSIGATDISLDGRWLAYSTDTTGFRQYTLHIKDLETGETLTEEIDRVGSIVWAADNRTLFYTVEDEEQKRQFQLWRGKIGELSQAVLVYQDDDERFNLGAGRTRDDKFLVFESSSHTTTESWVLAADSRKVSFRLISPREDEHEYSIDHRHGLWFIRTNDKGRRFSPGDRSGFDARPEHWTERIPTAKTSCLKKLTYSRSFSSP